MPVLKKCYIGQVQLKAESSYPFRLRSSVNKRQRPPKYQLKKKSAWSSVDGQDIIIAYKSYFVMCIRVCCAKKKSANITQKKLGKFRYKINYFKFNILLTLNNFYSYQTGNSPRCGLGISSVHQLRRIPFLCASLRLSRRNKCLSPLQQRLTVGPTTKFGIYT